MGWQWHQLDPMQIIYSLLQINNHANIVSLTRRSFSAQPTASKHEDNLYNATNVSTSLSWSFKVNLDQMIPVLLLLSTCSGRSISGD